jgi:hypothetical protein
MTWVSSCVREDGNGKIRLFEAWTCHSGMANPANGPLQAVKAEWHSTWMQQWSDGHRQLMKRTGVETCTPHGPQDLRWSGPASPSPHAASHATSVARSHTSFAAP